MSNEKVSTILGICDTDLLANILKYLGNHEGLRMRNLGAFKESLLQAFSNMLSLEAEAGAVVEVEVVLGLGQVEFHHGSIRHLQLCRAPKREEQPHLPLGAIDAGLAGGVHLDVGLERGCPSSVVEHCPGHGLINAIGIHMTSRQDFGRLLAVEHELAELETVDPDVKHAAAPELLLGDPVGLDLHPELGQGLVDVANGALLDLLLHLEIGRLEPRPDGLHEEELLLLGVGQHLLDFLDVHAQGLLTQDVLAIVKEELDQSQVRGVDGSNVDHLDVGIFGQGLIALVSLVNAKLVSKLLS